MFRRTAARMPFADAEGSGWVGRPEAQGKARGGSGSPAGDAAEKAAPAAGPFSSSARAAGRGETKTPPADPLGCRGQREKPAGALVLPAPRENVPLNRS